MKTEISVQFDTARNRVCLLITWAAGVAEGELYDHLRKALVEGVKLAVREYPLLDGAIHEAIRDSLARLSLDEAKKAIREAVNEAVAQNGVQPGEPRT